MADARLDAASSWAPSRRLTKTLSADSMATMVSTSLLQWYVSAVSSVFAYWGSMGSCAMRSPSGRVMLPSRSSAPSM